MIVVKPEIIEDVYNLCDAIKKDKKYIRLLELEKEIEDNYKLEIDEFNEAKEKYSEALKYGNYHPSLGEYEKKLSEKKAILYNKEQVKEYNLLYREIQNEIDDIVNKIKASISSSFGGHHECKK